MSGATLTDDNLRSIEFHAQVELQQQLPRKIRFTTRGLLTILANLVFSIALVALAVSGFFFNAKQSKNGEELVAAGRVISADDAYIVESRAFHVHYTFTYDGEKYRGESTIPEELSESVRKSVLTTHTLPILYVPSDPSINHPQGWRETEAPPWFLLFLVGTVLVLWLVHGKYLRQNSRLAREGTVAIGIVKRCSYGRNGGFLLKYEFRDQDDLLSEGKGYFPAAQREGARISVLYLPTDTGQNSPYPLFFFRAVV
jgi:hypothetical protein